MKIKFILSFAFVLLGFKNLNSQEIPQNTELILKQAQQQGKEENKNVFIMFTASWCGWCKKMKATMENTAIEKLFNDNYIIREIVVLERASKKQLENPGGEDLLLKYGGENQGIPFYLIFDNKGSLLADSKMLKNKEVLKGGGTNIGCPGTPEEIDAFCYKLKKTSNLTDKELITIAKTFKGN